MIDRELTIERLERLAIVLDELMPGCAQLVRDTVAMLKEQEEWLRKFQKDKDKLCLEVSEWKHKFHDAPPKFVSQEVVDQIRWERDTALSQLEQIGKGLGSKMDDIVALLKEQETANLYKCPNCSTWVSAENVVRCKDCKWNSGKPNIPYCQIRSEPHRNDWFCADGERKEGR